MGGMAAEPGASALAIIVDAQAGLTCLAGYIPRGAELDAGSETLFQR
jgi:hypothetical protein